MCSPGHIIIIMLVANSANAVPISYPAKINNIAREIPYSHLSILYASYRGICFALEPQSSRCKFNGEFDVLDFGIVRIADSTLEYNSYCPWSGQTKRKQSSSGHQVATCIQPVNSGLSIHNRNWYKTLYPPTGLHQHIHLQWHINHSKIGSGHYTAKYNDVGQHVLRHHHS